MTKKKQEQPLRLEWIDPADLEANEFNWRKHPSEQVATVKAAIDEVGWAGALLYNERTKKLIDGHCRKELYSGKGKVPVLIGSWTVEQERLILATLDPLAAMAEADQKMLDSLLATVHVDDPALEKMLDEMKSKVDEAAGDQTSELIAKFQVLVICKNESHQAELLERLTAEGLECRSLIS